MGDPDGEVAVCYLVRELLRETYLAVDVFGARRRLTVLYDHFTSSGVSELDRLARTITHVERTDRRLIARGSGASRSRALNYIISIEA